MTSVVILSRLWFVAYMRNGLISHNTAKIITKFTIFYNMEIIMKRVGIGGRQVWLPLSKKREFLPPPAKTSENA